MSKSVHDAFSYFGDAKTKETDICLKLWPFFLNCLNVRGLTEWAAKFKPDLKPYSSVDDPRLKIEKEKIYSVPHIFI